MKQLYNFNLFCLLLIVCSNQIAPGPFYSKSSNQIAGPTHDAHARPELDQDRIRDFSSALCNGDRVALQALVDSGLDINNIKMTRTPFQLALATPRGTPNNDISILDYLIELGANPHAIGLHNENAIHECIRLRNITALNYLIPHKVNLSHINNRNETPLDIAIQRATNEHYPVDCRKEYYAICEILHQAGASSSTPLKFIPTDEEMEQQYYESHKYDAHTCHTLISK